MAPSKSLPAVLPAVLVLSLAMGLFGCVSVTSTAVSLVGIASQQERGVGGRLSDLRASANVRRLLYDRNHEYAADLGVTVYDGHVVLTGAVESAEERKAIAELARSAGGVVGVTNEIIVIDRERLDVPHDALTTAKLEARLLLDPDVDAVNYSVTTVNRTVYIMGVARNRLERDRVVAHARDLERVRHVVTHVQLKTERDAAERAAGS